MEVILGRALSNAGTDDKRLQNENTIYLGNEMYFAPFLGKRIMGQKDVIAKLNAVNPDKAAKEEKTSERMKYQTK